MALLAKESAVVQMETKSISVCDSINFNGYCRCDLCNPRFLRCPGETKLGEDHPDTLQSFNNLGMVLHAQGQLEEAEAESGLVGSVKSLLIDRIASPPKLDEAAKLLGLSARGLRRKLEQSGTSYQKLLDSLRARIASRLLRDTDEPVSSIAYELGFDNPSDFGRAFKRWTGQSPSSLRQPRA